jgi:hypothetical protein
LDKNLVEKYMTIKIIIDTSEATEEEIDKFHDLARITPMLSMANNAKEYGLWIQLVDKPTASNFYAQQTFPGSNAAIIDFTKPISPISVGPENK